MIRLFFYLFFLFLCVPAISQPLAGTTGLLNIPSANMQEDGTFMAGANYLPISLTPPEWDYNTGNYYLNITFLPFMEISYRMTLYKLAGSNHFNNQDRSLSARFRIVKEKEYFPSVVIGSNDMYSSSQGFTVDRFFTSFYLTATKNLSYNNHKFGATAGYVYELSKSNYVSGVFGGISYSPSFLPYLQLMAEYDSRVFNGGASLLLFNHIYLFGMAHDLKQLTGGFAFLVYLNK